MSAKVDQFCDALRDRLNAVEGWFESVKADVKGMPEKADKALRAKLDQVRTKLQAEKERVEKAQANLKARAQQKIAETKEMISEWKAKHETRKLQARADWAEAYAADAVAVALASIDVAEEAVLDAVMARMDADAAK
jgi:peptidoglycan hydrolase CwlO-like protein